MDQESRYKLRVLLTQAEATEESLREMPSDVAWFRPVDTVPQRVNSLIRQAREGLQGTQLETLVPETVSPGVHGTIHSGSLIVAVSNLRAGLNSALDEEDQQAGTLREDIAVLKAKLAEAETRSLNIVDDELRDRCLDLLVRPGKADTAVLAATVVLEDRIRKVAGLGPEHYGVSLVDKALSPNGGVLDFGIPQPERQGLHQLYRGVIAFFKNPASHRLIENYDITRARQVVGLIDLLLQMLRDVKKIEPAVQASKPAKQRS